MKAKNERNRKLNIIKNKKLVKILNHKMFKGYRDIKASKWFFNQKPKFISQLTWENKIFDPFDDLYNLNYKMNVLYPLKNPTFDNLLDIKNYPSKEKRIITQETKISTNRPKTSFNSFSSSRKNLTTIDSQKGNKIINKRNNFYLTSASIYQTDNFYHEPNPQKVYKQIFEKDNIIYNDIPILSLDKIKSSNNSIKTKKKKKKKTEKERGENKYINKNKNEVIQTNNIHDDVYNGLTEKQFLYKISHNKMNKNIEEKININAFRKNKGVVKGFISKRLNSARPLQILSPLTLNMKKEPKDVTIELEYDNFGNMQTKNIITTYNNNLKEDLINRKNNYLIYNGLNNNISKNRNKSSSYRDSNETEDGIFGSPFRNFEKNKNKKKNIEPPIREFQNKPRIFDDKLLLQFQLDKKNKFLKLKKLME